MGIRVKTPLRHHGWLLLLFKGGVKQNDGAHWSTWRGCLLVAMPMLPDNNVEGGLCLAGVEQALCCQ